MIFGAAFASISLLTPHLWHLYTLFVVFGLVAMATSQVAYSRAISTWFQARLGAALVLHPLLAAAMAAGYAEVFADQRP